MKRGGRIVVAWSVLLICAAPARAEPPPRPAAPANGGDTQRVVAYVVGGTGLAAFAVSLGLGLWASSRWDDAQRLVGTQAGLDALYSARHAALKADVFALGGAVAVTAGVVLYLTAPRDRERRGVSVAPTLAPDGFGLAVSGGF